MTRQAFIKAYRDILLAKHGNTDPFTRRCISEVEAALTSAEPPAAWAGAAARYAWRQIGGKGEPTLEAIRGLPVEAP